MTELPRHMGDTLENPKGNEGFGVEETGQGWRLSFGRLELVPGFSACMNRRKSETVVLS